MIIFAVLLLVYRSVITVILLLVTVGIELFSARGIVAFLADNNIVVLSTFAINLLVALAMAAGTDYGIFFFGRYQELRQAGEDRETAYYTTYRGVAPVVLGALTLTAAVGDDATAGAALSVLGMALQLRPGTAATAGALDFAIGASAGGTGTASSSAAGIGNLSVQLGPGTAATLGLLNLAIGAHPS